jgi:predicted Zn-dependent protease
MHELGHVLGLGHVQDPSQLMYPAHHGQATYGPGDLAGLAAEGDGAC